MIYITCGIIAVVCAVIGMAIGDLGGKKNGVAGLLLGGLLGPLGCVIAALLPAEVMQNQGMRPTTWILLMVASAVPVAIYCLMLYLKHGR